MLIYYIDAFNLIHKIEPILDSAAPHATLIQYIAAKNLTGSATNKVVIVFDGYEPKGQLLDGPYEIAFGRNCSADDIIKERVSKAKNKRQIVVVSDDHSVRDHARGEGARVMHIEEFLKPAQKVKRRSGEYDEKPVSDELREDLEKELGEIWVKSAPREK